MMLQLTGYDKTTERVMVEYALPNSEAARIKWVAGIYDEDKNVLGCYKLTRCQVIEMCKIAGVVMDPGTYDYFLEAYCG